jgi:hypothetical protein
MNACWAHRAPLRVYTYTAPALNIVLSASFPLMPAAPLLSVGAPTASVVPSALNATAWPNWSPSSGCDALM